MVSSPSGSPGAISRAGKDPADPARDAYPATAIRWTIDAQNHDFPASIFKSIILASGLRVVIEHDFPDPRQRLRADSIRGDLDDLRSGR